MTTTPDISGPEKNIPPYRPVVTFGDLIFTSGVVAPGIAPDRPAIPLRQQLQLALGRFGYILENHDSGLENLVQVRCYLSTMSDIAVMNQVYREIVPSPLPARTTVGVELREGVLFEVEGIATLNTGRVASGAT